MVPAPTPSNDAARLADLRKHHILDTPPDPAFDDLAAIAADIFGVPMALVSLVDAERQWLKSRVGLEVSETPRGPSFCGHTICADEPLVVPDALRDIRFHDNPLVTGAPYLRFYAGAPLVSQQGHALGSLCVLDTNPRAFSAGEVRRLTLLAGQASRQLEMHRILIETDRAARLDSLTGLLSRRGLLDRIADHLHRRAADPSWQVAAAFVDLDRFKPINDTHGHAAGDAVLRLMGRRFEAAAGQVLARIDPVAQAEAHVARLGGDEFVALVAGRCDADTVGSRITEALLQAARRPVRWSQRRLNVSASAGLVVADRQTLDGESLLSGADVAMYQAKQAGPGRIERFAAPMLLRLREDLDLEARLRVAIAQRRIETHFQPIVGVSDAQTLGFEALARWTDAELGPIAPPRFIKLAERAGLIDDVFEQVASAAVAALPALQIGAETRRFISLNLSKLQLRDPMLPARLLAMAARARILPGDVHLEVTESDVASHPGAIGRLEELARAGFVLMLDDFGTGTSSLSSLHTYPVSWLKVDRAFSVGACGRRDLAAIVAAIKDLTHNLGLRVVAEGIETPDQLALFQALSFDAVQGYLYSRPVPLGKLVHWLIRRSTAPHRRSA